MFSTPAFFEDRADAGRRLAAAVASEVLPEPLVMALPRGGVPVAFEIAIALGAPLEVLIARKIGAPGHPEFGLGALVDGQEERLVLNREAVRLVRPPRGYLAAEAERQRAEIARRRQLYLGERQPLSPRQRNVVLVDDGIATGGTIRAAIEALRLSDVGHLLLAVPVAPASAIASLRSKVDGIVCLSAPAFFRAVGLHYRDFEQTSDAEVITLLERARVDRGEA